MDSRLILAAVAITASVVVLLGGCASRSANIPYSGDGATKTIALHSNQNCAYYVDSRLMGRGRDLRLVVEDAPHEIHCVADGYRTKIEYANPPFVEHYVVGFTFMIGDRLKPDERADVPSEPDAPLGPSPRVVPTGSQVVATGSKVDPGQLPRRDKEPPGTPYRALYARRLAVVVGINQYAELPPLEGAIADAQRVAAALRQRGFDVLEIYDREATQQKILNMLGTQLARKSQPEDLVVIYFAGHGETETLPNGEKRGYILPVDTRTDDLFSSGISMAQLRDLSARLRAKHVYYVMDSCYSGMGFTRGFSFRSTTPGFIEKVTSLRAVQMLTAGMEDEPAEERGGRGLFTDYFLRALEGEADLDNDGHVTASEIGNFVRPQVTAQSQAKQTPQFGTLEGSGEIVFPLPKDP